MREREKINEVGIAGVVRQHFSVTVLFGVHAALVAVAWAVISLKMPARVPATGIGLFQKKEKKENVSSGSFGIFLFLSLLADELARWCRARAPAVTLATPATHSSPPPPKKIAAPASAAPTLLASVAVLAQVCGVALFFNHSGGFSWRILGPD